MSRIPRIAHGIIDYVYAALLFASPWIFRFHQEREANIAVGLGAAVLVYSFFTNYECGVIRMIPFPMHLFVDFVLGVLLATSWLHFGSGGRAGVVFTIFGLASLLVALFTERGLPMSVPRDSNLSK